MRNIFGDQGNMERNFWKQGNSVKVNFGEQLNLFLRNKGTTVNLHREQGNMHPPGRPSVFDPQICFLEQTEEVLLLLPPKNQPVQDLYQDDCDIK